MIGPSNEPRMIRLRINGEDMAALAEPRMLLSDFLRHELGLTGTHVGCEHGVCGACSVNLDGSVIRSCITFAVQVDGSTIETIEGVAPGEDLHPIQKSFQEEHGLQCGFCTPGLVVTTKALLKEHPNPSEEEIREYLSGNICRCTGYVGVVAAVKSAALKLQAESANDPSEPVDAPAR
jgi:aerobic carbon-monoxide dehydrogenase small subunit